MAGKDNNKSNGDASLINDGPEQTEEANDETISEEYNMLDSKLDELNTALDYIEQKNDDIHEKLRELLQSNIEIRQQLRNENNVINLNTDEKTNLEHQE